MIQDRLRKGLVVTMTRKEVREHLFQMLFVVDFHGEEELAQQVSHYLEGVENMPAAVSNELEEKFFDIVSHRAQIDAKIQEKARGWTLQRLAKADVTVLRLAIYEILFDEKIPSGVAVNEAVEIAKKFGTDNSPSFVNGVLGSIVRDLEKE